MNVSDPQVWVARSATLAASAFHRLLPDARIESWPDLVMSDRGDPHWLYNWAVLQDRIGAERSDELVDRLRQFYGPTVGSYSVWDPWRTLDLQPHGFEPEVLPFMVRQPGGPTPPQPKGLSIRPGTDLSDLEDFGRLVAACFDPRGGTGAVASQRFAAISLTDRRYRIWLGEFDGRPVTCSTAFVATDALYVDFVSTLPEHRGRGYGEAMTWAATQTEPTLPATLHATDAGKSTYVRMGYRTIADAHLWYPAPGA